MFDLMSAEGFSGSFVGMARHLKGIRGPRLSAAPADSTRMAGVGHNLWREASRRGGCWRGGKIGLRYEVG